MSDDFSLKTHGIHVRHTQEADLPAVVLLYSAVCDAMRDTPYDVSWDMSYHPTEARLLSAIHAGEMLVAERDGNEGGDERFLGAAIVNGVQEKGYEAADWTVSADPDRVAVVHLLATAPWARHVGAGRALIDASAKYARQVGCMSMRLDVWPNNEPARAMYERCGMLDKGIHTLDYDSRGVALACLMELPLV